MIIKAINKYFIEVLEKQGFIETNLTKKQLEDYIKNDIELDGMFKPNRLLNKIRKDGHYFIILKI